MSVISALTALISAACHGDAGALDQLFETLYLDLRRIARAKMRQTDERLPLDTTALVHECYLRLLKL